MKAAIKRMESVIRRLLREWKMLLLWNSTETCQSYLKTQESADVDEENSG